MAKIYFIQGSISKKIKIGIATSIPRRLAGLQTSSFERLDLLLEIMGDIRTERKLHRMFAKFRIRGEWFEPSPEILEFVTLMQENNDKPYYDWHLWRDRIGKRFFAGSIYEGSAPEPLKSFGMRHRKHGTPVISDDKLAGFDLSADKLADMWNLSNLLDDIPQLGKLWEQGVAE